MNPIVILSISIACFILVGRFYARLISRSIGIDSKRITPAVRINDACDYVPTATPIVFAHHFATIAGAGPIIGPVMAIIYGWRPAWLWVLIGGIFFGAVHDFFALFVSIREGGKSIAEVARKSLGTPGFIIVISFTIVMLILVNATFLNASTTALTSIIDSAQIGLSTDQVFFRWADETGVKIVIGGIASMSVIIVTAFAPLIGYLYIKRHISVVKCSIFAILICITSVIIGFFIPITLNPFLWMILISLYTVVAAGVPVWIFLQSRDFINVHLLYIGLGLLFTGIFMSGIKGVKIQFPVNNIQEGISHVGFLWPGLFITIACGAISGFHALCAGGTISKQIKSELAIHKIGYCGMLLESFLALCVICAVIMHIDVHQYKELVLPGPESKFHSNPILAFALAMGRTLYSGFGLPLPFGILFGMLLLEGFIITTLDTAVRLNRYLFEELWRVIFKNPPKILSHYWINSALAAGLMFGLAYKNTVNNIWSIFGTANQLLAALTLIIVSFWLLSKRKNIWFTAIPALFMIVTTISMLIILLIIRFIPQGNITLIITDIILLGLSLCIITIATKTFLNRFRTGISHETSDPVS
ncbi:MAG: Carbon starvation protein A [Candidatus Jettenia ecosi]|uniref:Carbon starvation protein A n=1 Tax=Candidatus Jettenia ecosi TaxID=2494326 RepID=A0A533QEV9_9BACT|nr:MAG: Carbon starvation protein A [Candidatus Jettenia ecosi]